MQKKTIRPSQQARTETDPATAHEIDKRLLDRMLFFSDAVFAIVLTLLVLDLRPPEHLGEGPIPLGELLGSMAGAFVSFINSFALVGLWWFVHMRITRPLRHFDWPVALLNFLFLLTVTLVPFASALLTSHGNTGTAWEIYWGVNLGSSLTLVALSLSSTRGKGRLIGGISTRLRLFWAIRILSPGLCFVAGIWIAASGQVGPAHWAWIPIPFMMALIGGIQKRLT